MENRAKRGHVRIVREFGCHPGHGLVRGAVFEPVKAGELYVPRTAVVIRTELGCLLWVLPGEFEWVVPGPGGTWRLAPGQRKAGRK